MRAPPAVGWIRKRTQRVTLEIRLDAALGLGCEGVCFQNDEKSAVGPSRFSGPTGKEVEAGGPAAGRRCRPTMQTDEDQSVRWIGEARQGFHTRSQG